MPPFADDLQECLDDLFEEAGVQAVYSRGTASLPVAAIFGPLAADDVVSEHVLADSLVCQLRESEILDWPFNRQPLRGDVITRELPAGGDGAARQQALEVVQATRDESGCWRLICQQNIRVVP